MYRFGQFQVSTESRRLSTMSGDDIPLTPRVFDLLVKLVESEGRILSKNEILESVWQDCVVEESNLSQSIFVLRKALGESTQSPLYIRTIPTRGYRFIGDVSVVQGESSDISPAVDIGTSDAPLAVRSAKRPLIYAVLVLAGLLVAVGFVRAYFPFSTAPAGNDGVSYQQLTFERGTVWSARFLANSNEIVYNANFNDRGLDLFTLHTPSTESRSMGRENTSLLAVSSRGEMAILHDETYVYQFIHRGTLARMAIDGSAMRDIADNVQEADWSGNGEDLAVVRWTQSGDRIEYPVGNVLGETHGYFSCPRIAPAGDRIAVLSHPFQKDNRGSVIVIGTDGRMVASSSEWGGLEGLAWHGKEVWFTASKSGEAYALYGMSEDGTVRNVLAAPTNLLLNDIDASGSVLLSRATQQTDVYLNTSDHRDSDLSWLQLIGPADLSADGSAFLFTHFGAGSGKNYSVYIRRADGSAAVKLGSGRALALSPDGRTAIAKISDPEGLVLLPTGPGGSTPVPTADLEHFGAAAWFPDGKRIIFIANEKGRPRRTFSVDPQNGEITPITPEGIFGTILSPDGMKIVTSDADGERVLLDLTSGSQEAVKGLDASEEIVRWASDGSSLYVYKPLDLPLRVYKLSVLDGRRELIKEIAPTNSSGVFGNIYLFMTADAKTTLYGLRRYLIDLYLVNGLK
jgi:DNA-binding winged helix-turn-helix (wHTH) protein/dipeptidyl aminopeptidase/acylaminoacyl peptidase